METIFKNQNIEIKGNIKSISENSYRLECGHNNAGILNVYPFKTWICFECGFKSDRLIEVLQ